MKFIHTADLHLESRMDILPTEKSRIRRDEILRTFEKLIDYANLNGVRAIIIAGDMFDVNKISLKTKQRVLSAIKKYSHIDFLYASGNHDQNNAVFSLDELPSNFIVFGDEWKSIEYDDCVLTGAVLNSINNKTLYDNLRLDEQKINIVILHGQVAGYKTNEQTEIISIPLLKDKNVDYLALGHIHSYSTGEIDKRGTFAYSGCLDGRGFDELGQKGFVLLDCDNKKVNSTFIPFSSRTLYEFEYDVTESENFFELADKIVLELSEKIDSSSLVKVVLKGKHKLDYFVDTFALSQKLNDIFFFARIYDKTQLQISLSDYELDKSVKGEFVRAVFESDLNEEEKNKIIACGLNALSGEGV